MNNPHIIVSDSKRCLCGMYGNKAVGCRDVLASLNSLVEAAKIKGSGPSHYAHDIFLIEEVLKPLIEDRP